MTNNIHPDWKKVAYVWGLTLISLSMLLLSCSPSKKAHDYFEKNKPEFAEDCADAFPVIPIIDSTDYKNSLQKLELLQQEKNGLTVSYERDVTWLRQEIVRIKRNTPASANCDSLSDAIYRLAAAEKKRGDSLHNLLSKTIQSGKEIAPIKETKVDSARIKACEQAAEKAISKLNDDIEKLREALMTATLKNSEISSDRDKWKSKARHDNLLLWLVIIVCGTITFRNPILKLIKSFV